MQSAAQTVDEYLDSLSAERRSLMQEVRRVVAGSIDPRYSEIMQYGMIGWVLPHSVFPAGYHCDPRQPLPFAALASQKNYVSLYLMGLSCGCEAGEEHEDARWFREAWAASGKKSWTWARHASASRSWTTLPST